MGRLAGERVLVCDPRSGAASVMLIPLPREMLPEWIASMQSTRKRSRHP